MKRKIFLLPSLGVALVLFAIATPILAVITPSIYNSTDENPYKVPLYTVEFGKMVGIGLGFNNHIYATHFSDTDGADPFSSTSPFEAQILVKNGSTGIAQVKGTSRSCLTNTGSGAGVDGYCPWSVWAPGPHATSTGAVANRVRFRGRLVPYNTTGPAYDSTSIIDETRPTTTSVSVLGVDCTNNGGADDLHVYVRAEVAQSTPVYEIGVQYYDSTLGRWKESDDEYLNNNKDLVTQTYFNAFGINTTQVRAQLRSSYGSGSAFLTSAPYTVTCNGAGFTGGGGTENCGDSTTDTGEQCDDGNVESYDGCDEFCADQPELLCGDSTDNDGDGDTDCADSDCSEDTLCTFELDCDDSTDNDGDGDTDCEDSDCSEDSACVTVETECSDSTDNDGDGDTDCADSDCSSDPLCSM